MQIAFNFKIKGYFCDMARTKTEIFDALIALKDANAILSPVWTSASKAAFYRNLFDLVAEFAGDFELTFDDFVTEIEAVMASKQVHNDLWWQRISLEYQAGDALTTFDNGNLGYDPVVEANQLIKRAAVLTTQVGAITLKVAKLDVDEITPIPLTVGEKASFDAYINDMQPAGIVPTTVSVAGDELQIGLAIVADTQLINIDDGTLLSDGVTKPVEAAIQAYYETFQGDDFGGIFYSNNMLAGILSATGVINATFVNLDKKGANEVGFTNVLTLPGRSFTAYSGYVKTAAGWVLSDNITYTAE